MKRLSWLPVRDGSLRSGPASPESATLLVMHHPAGFERYFEEMKQLAARGGSTEERAALSARFDMFPVPESMES